MRALTLKQIARWCGGTVAPEFAGIEVSGVSTDTRSIQPGQLFVALAGPNFDGHSFARSALAKGAAAVLAHKQLDADVPAIYVENTLQGLGDMARGLRADCGYQVVGITGSVGKTTTKEMTADILATTYATARTAANHNNNIGLPQSIMDIPEGCEVAVLEMGMNHFREIAYLTAIARPDLAVITNIGTMHIEHLGSREGILKAKLEILEGLRPDGKILLNGDEPLLWNLRDTISPKPLYFGIENEACQLRAVQLRQENGGTSFTVRGLGEEFQVFVPAEGTHNVYDALAAIGAGLLYHVRPEEIQKALSTFQNTGSRQSIYEKNGFTIIEDCYNAGPESMQAALEVLSEHAKGRKIAVLGDMLELGACSAAEHYRVGRIAAGKADLVFAYGPHGNRVVTGAVTGGISAKHTACFDSHEDLVKTLRRVAKPGDTLLFKGSRGMRMEQALAQFLAQDGE